MAAPDLAFVEDRQRREEVSRRAPRGKRDAAAGAFYSHDFDWESLCAEVESKGFHESTDSMEITAEEDNTSEELLRSTAWEAFYRRHSNALFFKERRYLLKEFPELNNAANPLSVLEIGCGTGGSVVPILRGNDSAHVYACDCSPAALEKATAVVRNEAGLLNQQSSRFFPFCCNLCVQQLPSWLCCSACQASFQMPPVAFLPHGVEVQQPRCKEVALLRCQTKGSGQSPQSAVMAAENSAEGSQGEKEGTQPVEVTTYVPPCVQQGTVCCLGGVDIVTMIFTLSAMRRESMPFVLKETFRVMKPGGQLFFRDYGLYDMTMLRFPASQRIGSCLYQRIDGTLCYYFSCEALRDLATGAGLVELMNRKTQSPMKRVWIHGKFHKPASAVEQPC